MREARFYRELEKGKVRCELCPRECIIAKGERGFCKARKNENGRLIALTYGNPCSMNVDPIEKKPLYHVKPGSSQFSIATVGCNLSCKFCQNWRISQGKPKEGEAGRTSPEEVVKMAGNNDCQGIAYTYTEPTVFYEWSYDIAKLAKEEGLGNYFITNGYINEEVLKEIAPFLDAANIDLKSFKPSFYEKLVGGADIEAVKEAIKCYYENQVWVEITNLIIPGYNDDLESIRKMARWILEELDPNVPLHLSRFFPYYKLRDAKPTPWKTLKKAREAAKEEGLNFVYVGNIRKPKVSNTYCQSCGKLVIERSGLRLVSNKLEDGKCPNCGAEIPGLF